MQLGSRDNLHSCCKKAGSAEERGKDERMSLIILERRCRESITLQSARSFVGRPKRYVAWLLMPDELVTRVDLRRDFIRETDKNASV